MESWNVTCKVAMLWWALLDSRGAHEEESDLGMNVTRLFSRTYLASWNFAGPISLHMGEKRRYSLMNSMRYFMLSIFIALLLDLYPDKA